MSDALRGSRRRSASLHPTGPRLLKSGLVGAEMSMGLSPASQNAGTPQAPRTQLQELKGQTVPAKGWDVGWPIASCLSIAQTPLHSGYYLTSYFVPGLSRLAKAVSTKLLWMPGKSPAGSRSCKPFLPTVGTDTTGLPDNVTASAMPTGESGLQVQ